MKLKTIAGNWLRGALGVSLFAFLGAAGAQDYPQKHVTIVVNVPPGANSDILARIVADRLSSEYGKKFVVENRPGGANVLGMEVVARAPADGHTLLFTHAGPIVLDRSSDQVTPSRDLVPVSVVAGMPYVFMGHPKLPASNIKELLAYANKKPEGLLFANQSVGSDIHLLIEVFKRETKANIKLVPYQGGAPAIKDLLGGHIDSIFTSNVGPYLKPGLLRAYAVATDKRWVRYPDIPTLKEQGIENVDGTSWWGLFAPVGTPADILENLNGAIRRTLHTEEGRQKIGDATEADVIAEPLAQTTAFVSADRDKWQAVLKDTGIELK